MSLLNELKRRNVLRVGAAYIVAAWLVIQVVETIFPAFGFGDAAIRIVTIVSTIGLIPTLIFAWAFEMTSEGLKKESEVDRSQSITTNTGKKLDRMIMVVLALALGYFAFDKFVLNQQREADLQEQKEAEVEQALQKGRAEARVESYGDKSIAVLPFVNMSDDASNEYFSDGISEELLNLLTKIPELRVISRSSAFSFKDKDTEIPEIARRLNVAHILEGSVRKFGDQVRITAQLIEARSDTHLWSDTYDRTLDNIFAIQDEIATEVVTQLRVTLLGDVPKAKETSPEAYTLYLQARHLGNQGTPESLQRSQVLYKQALEIEPDYAAAWHGLARIYPRMATHGLQTFAEGFRLSREAADKALEIDPDYALAQSTLSSVAMYSDGDLITAARHLGRALALEPANADIVGGAATLAGNLGRLDESLALIEYWVANDPVNPIAYSNLGLGYLNAGRSDEAVSAFNTALSLGPGLTGAHFGIGWALLQKGELEAALTAMLLETHETRRLIGQSMAYHALGREDDSDAALAELIDKYEQEWAYNIAEVLAFRGDADRAFEWLAKAVEYNDPGLSEIPLDDLFNNIREDSRWLVFLESIGKSPAQLDAIEFDVKLPD